MLLTYIINAVNNRFNLSIANGKCFNRHDDAIECYHYCLVTQDWDELNEFIYMNELMIPDEKRPLYFTPQSNYGCLLLPKIKIRWAVRAKQIKLGQKLYNILEGTWNANGAFLPNLASTDVKVEITPYHGKGDTVLCSTVLIPFKNYTTCCTVSGVPSFNIADDTVSCVHNTAYFNVSFNRQGMYINRKYREKVEQIVQSLLPDNYVIIEPGTIHVRFTDTSDLKINLS